ncbi:MAG: toxin [Bacteroidota bacterium]
MDAKKEDVERFLRGFKEKIAFFDVIIKRERSENLQTMLDLELTNLVVREHLKKLIVEDFYKGPTKDDSGGSDLWEFGKTIKNKEVYIKISLGNLNKPVICISFHYPIRTIKYPFK